MSHRRTILICEDTLQCFFFSSTELSKTEWEHLCESINECIKSISKDYIWHRDEFKVVVPILEEVTKDTPQHLISITCFGDNIEDEWFIVYIIWEITKMFNNLIVQIEDNDGDFLLIEAADYLPQWATPETTVNRVFIHNQHLHIIPDKVVSIDTAVKLIDAIKLIALEDEETKASVEIEQAIAKKIGNPQGFKENCHKVILKLPSEIATVLTLKPSLISPIVTTYCSIDSLDAKHCKEVKINDCINVEIMFTKYLYAMLLQSKLPNYVKHNLSNKERKIQLGHKVMYGYRILMSRLSKDISYIPEFKIFFDSLTKNGYFKDNLEGSLAYSELLDKAKTYFFNMECPVSSCASSIINELKSSDKFNSTRESLKEKSDTDLLQEDDDNWLNVSPDDLNDFLNSRYNKNIKLKNNDPITPHILTSELADFIKATSDFEGIEEYEIKDNVENNTIDFDSEEFVNSVHKMLNLVSNNNTSYNDSDNSSSDDDCNDSHTENDIDKIHNLELASNLKSFKREGLEDSVLINLTQSVKEEGRSGPASNILRQIGLQKTDILDSDDNEV